MLTRNYSSDFFRLFFTMIVVFHHCNVSWLNNGYLAVEFFFILSGYFVMQKYDKKGENINALEYTRDRINKLYPHYLFSLVIIFLCYIIMGKCSTIDDFFRVIPEIFLVQDIGIFHVNGGINSPLWYLSVLIVGSYFLFYLIARYKDHFTRFVAPLIIICVFTLILNDGVGLENWTRKVFIYIPLFRGIADMCIGIIIYEVCKVQKQKSKINIILLRIFEVISILGLLLIFSINENYDMYAIVFISYILYSCFNKESIIYKTLNRSIFGRIEKYLYPIYLNHYLFVLVLGKLTKVLNPTVSIIIMLLCLWIYSIFTYNLVNKVIYKIKNN